ncbi:MAG: hypothetical protein F6K40_29745 [Okeania sp. SIO3I5]|uniref:hypothetical protein n=1 Tax=Okeania sp. SIO3I5 TaxID=2607805 RepID=UPI0013BCB5D7|nr:hypothetical protein [Okeania sp. SIO3I5]NEQ40201.1 hypothetical protein [Okeania sp. SIO3I5]
MDILKPFYDLIINPFAIGFTIFFFVVGLVAAFDKKCLIFAIIAAIIMFFLTTIFSSFIQNIQATEAQVIDINYSLLALTGGFALGKISQWITKKLLM